jgi:hypothetical protein
VAEEYVIEQDDGLQSGYELEGVTKMTQRDLDKLADEGKVRSYRKWPKDPPRYKKAEVLSDLADLGLVDRPPAVNAPRSHAQLMVDLSPKPALDAVKPSPEPEVRTGYRKPEPSETKAQELARLLHNASLPFKGNGNS